MFYDLKTKAKKLRREESGAVAVEFALLAPVLFALLFGIIAVGYAVGISHSIHQLATSAARASVEGLDESERRGIADQYLSQAGQHYPLLDSTLFDRADTTQVTITDGSAPSITIKISYPLDNSMLSIANGFLGMDLNELTAEAYLVY